MSEQEKRQRKIPLIEGQLSLEEAEEALWDSSNTLAEEDGSEEALRLAGRAQALAQEIAKLRKAAREYLHSGDNERNER